MDRAICRGRMMEMIGVVLTDLYPTAEAYISAGAIDVSGAEDNYVLPKLLIQAALHKVADGIAIPNTKENRAIARNLSRF